MSSIQDNAKPPGSTSTGQKSSIATKPPKTTPMQAFLTEVKKTTYGPVLAEIDAFVTEIVKEDDREINNTKDSFKNLVEQSRETDEKAITDWFDTVKNKLKPKILAWTNQPVGAHPSTDPIFNFADFEIAVEGNAECIKAAAVVDKQVDDYFLAQLPDFQRSLAKRKTENSRDFAKYAAVETKRYERVCKEVEEGLLASFTKLKIVEVNAEIIPVKEKGVDDKEKEGSDEKRKP